LLSPTQRQSGELFRKVLDGYRAIGRPIETIGETQLKMELTNGSCIICLPGKEETIRSFSSVALLIIDEAARVPEDLYKAVRPMLAVSKGQLIALSTPWGQRGWFFQAWSNPIRWECVKITWKQCPRITSDYVSGPHRVCPGGARVRNRKRAGKSAAPTSLAGVDRRILYRKHP